MIDTHCEKNLVVNNRELIYKGIFKADELFSVINQALEKRGYEKREKKTEELVREEGRKTYIELRPYKVMTNYVTLMIKIKIDLDGITEAVEEIKGEKRKFQQGDVKIVFDAWSLTDYENRWGMKPWAFFLKAFINKFIFNFPTETGFTGLLVGDTAFVYAQIMKLLKSYKYEAGKVVKEEDVIKSVEEDIARGDVDEDLPAQVSEEVKIDKVSEEKAEDYEGDGESDNADQVGKGTGDDSGENDSGSDDGTDDNDKENSNENKDA